MMEQRTPEWFAARCGKVTASRLADVMARTKSGYSASRQNYMADLICQRLTGKMEEGFSNAAMMRGTELEPVARDMYALNEFDAEITEVGLIDHPAIYGFAASPDGLVNDDGLIEIKCPNTWTHLETLKTGEPKRQYMLQMHAQNFVINRSGTPLVMHHSRHHATNSCKFTTRTISPSTFATSKCARLAGAIFCTASSINS